MYDPKFNIDFYEDESDPLATFRKHYGGGVVGKNGIDPFNHDPDVLQSEREEKLREAERNSGYGE